MCDPVRLGGARTIERGGYALCSKVESGWWKVGCGDLKHWKGHSLGLTE